jgi:hypothetical protein
MGEGFPHDHPNKGVALAGKREFPRPGRLVMGRRLGEGDPSHFTHMLTADS